MKINLIAAVAQNGVIGRNNTIPWKLKDDMSFFRKTTADHVVVMGRRTMESLGGKPLKNRTNVVLSSTLLTVPDPGFHLFEHLSVVLHHAKNWPVSDIFIIGGARLYEEAIPLADVFYRTRVLADVPGDVYFPAFNALQWDAELISSHVADDRNEYPFVIEKLTRR